MPEFRVLITIFHLLLLGSFALSQDANQDSDHPPACVTYARVQIPVADLPTPQDRKALASCKSENLYFGFDRPPDPVAARKCAYLARDAGEETIFGGTSLLTMIYANGKGATRDFDLALRFACELTHAPAENYGRFDHLLKLKAEQWTGDDFNLCDDATSGYMQGACAALQEKFDRVARAQKLSKIVERWSPAERTAFSELQRAAEKFFEASAENEVDLSGTARAAFEIEAKASLEDGFVAALEKFARGDLPNYSPSDFARADAELNSAYSAIQAKKPDAPDVPFGTLTPQGIQIAERAWLAYREAWVKFGQVKYPGVAAHSWRAWLTRERLQMLSSPD